MELILPTKQVQWGWPAVANFFLGGAGAGFYILSFITKALDAGSSALSDPVSLGILAPILVALGFVALSIEAGRPSRGLYLFHHLRRAWISRETLFCGFFVVAVVLNQFFNHPGLRVIALTAALGFMVSQGFIVYGARSVTAWNVPIMPLLFFTSSLVSGHGLVLVSAAFGKLPMVHALAIIGLTCVVINLAVWLLYLLWTHDDAFQMSTREFRRPTSLIIIVGVGHFAPLILLSMLLIGPEAYVENYRPYIVAVASGLAMTVGAAAQKAGIINIAGYTRAISLKN